MLKERHFGSSFGASQEQAKNSQAKVFIGISREMGKII